MWYIVKTNEKLVILWCLALILKYYVVLCMYAVRVLGLSANKLNIYIGSLSLSNKYEKLTTW